MQSFYSYLYPRKSVRNRNFTLDGHAVDRFVAAIKRRFGCTPLFNPGYESFFEIRSTKGKVL